MFQGEIHVGGAGKLSRPPPGSLEVVNIYLDGKDLVVEIRDGGVIREFILKPREKKK